MIEEQIIEKFWNELRSADEIDPYKEDGCYELVQLAGRLYAEHWPESVDYPDLDLFYWLVTIEEEPQKQKRIKACSLSASEKEQLQTECARIYKNVRAGYYSEWAQREKTTGIFRRGFSTFKREITGVPSYEVEGLVQLFVKLAACPEEEPEKKIAWVEEKFKHGIGGIQTRSLSQILHCIDPYTFPIINENEGRKKSIYTVLNIDGLPGPSKIFNNTEYAKCCRVIREWRDANDFSFTNYRVIDLIGFGLPVPRKKKEDKEYRALEGVSEMAQLDALENFVEGIHCLDEVEECIEKANLFRVLDITDNERRHSNVLSWLFDTFETHGFGDAFLRRFLGLIEGFPMTDCASLEDVVVEKDKYTGRDQRGYVDIHLLSEANNFVVIIENKTRTSEHSNQLSRYYEYAEKRYPEKSKYHIYLTLQGEAASDSDNWQSVSYAQIASLLDDCMEEKKDELAPDSEMIVQHYIDAVRMDLLGEDPVKKIAKDIYRKHRRALEVIFNSRPDDASFAMDKIARALEHSKKEVQVLEDSREGTKFRFSSRDNKPSIFGKSYFMIEAKEDCISLSFRYPFVDNMSVEERSVRRNLIEALSRDPDNIHFIAEVELPTKWLISSIISGSEDYLRVLAEEAICQAEAFAERASKLIDM